jgi:hypothetical protein
MCKRLFCGGSDPTPPPEIVISGLWIRGLNRPYQSFCLSFLQKESGFQGKALRISTGEKRFAHSLQMSVFKKWWVWATPDYNHPDFAKAVLI